MPNDLGFQSFDEMRSLAASPEGANRGYQSFDEMVALSSGDGDKDKEKQEERRSRPKIGAAESLRLGRKAETGDDASTLEAVGAQLTLGVQPVVDTIRTSALQQLASGKKKTFFRGEVPFSELPDYEVSNMAKMANLDMPLMDSPLKQWDKTRGAEIADPKERRAERAKFIQAEATNELKRKLQNKIDAGRELSGRDKTLWAKLGGGFVENAGYTGAFMRGGVGAVGTSIARRYGDLQADEQTLVDGEVETVDKGDAQGTAMSKGAAGGTAEYLIEKYGTEAPDFLIGGTLKRIPGVGPALAKAGGTAAGKAIAGVAKKFARLGEITGKQNLAGEIFAEELPQALIDQGLGLDKRGSAKLLGTAEDTKQAAADFFRPQALGDMALGMLLMQAAQAGTAGAEYYKDISEDRNRLDGTLAAFGANPDLLKTASMQEKQEILATLRHKLTPEQSVKVLERLGNKADGLYKSITEQEGYDFDAKKNGITSAFRLPAPGEGDGRERLPDGSLLYDHAESGIGIVEHPGGKATVYDRDGDMQEFKTLGEAVKAAHGLSVRNQVIDMRREQKAKYVEATARRLSPGVKVRVHNTEGDLLAEVPEAAQSPDFAANASGIALGDTIHLVLDNIKTPRGAVSTILHEAGVHAGLNNVLKGEAKERFLANLGGQEAEKFKALSGKLGYVGQSGPEEALAYMYEHRLANPTGYQRAVAWAHDQLRKVNPDYKFTDSDIEVMMADAQRSVRASQGGSVTLTGEETGKARSAAYQNAAEDAYSGSPSVPGLTAPDHVTPPAQRQTEGQARADLAAMAQENAALDGQQWTEAMRAARNDVELADRLFKKWRGEDAKEEIEDGTAFEGMNRQESAPNVQFQGNQRIRRGVLEEGMRRGDVEDNPYRDDAVQPGRKPRRPQAQPEDNRVAFDSPKEATPAETEAREMMRGDRLQRRMDQLSEQSKGGPEFRPIVGVKRASEKIAAVLGDNWNDMSVEERRTLFDLRDGLTRENAGKVIDALDMFVLDLQTRPDGAVQESLTPEKGTLRSEKEEVVPVSEAAAQTPSPAPEAKTADVAQQTPTAKKAQAQESPVQTAAEAQEGAQDRAGAKADAPVSAQVAEAQKAAEAEKPVIVAVRDVDGGLVHVDKAQLDDTGRQMLRIYDKDGKDWDKRKHERYGLIHRSNIIGQSKPEDLLPGTADDIVTIKALEAGGFRLPKEQPRDKSEERKATISAWKNGLRPYKTENGEVVPGWKEAANGLLDVPMVGVIWARPSKARAADIKVKLPSERKAEAQEKADAEAKAERAAFDAAVKAKFWATGNNRLRADKAKAVKDGEELKKIGGEFERMWLAEKAKADRMKAAGKVKALAEAVGMREEDQKEETVKDAISRAEAETATPTEGQKEAGNYKKGRFSAHGFDIVVENPVGSVRSGVSKDGKPWRTEMKNTYGYFSGDVAGKDGDKLDVFLGPDVEGSGNVYVVDQVDPSTGDFDEHKVMLGFSDVQAAREAYEANYQKGWKGLKSITGVPLDDFRKWLESSGRKLKPFAEYAGVKPSTEAAPAATAQTKNRQSIDKVEPEEKKGTPRSEKERLVHADAAPTGKQALQVQSHYAATDTAPKTPESATSAKDTPNVASATPDVSPSTADAAVKVETEPGGDKTVSVPSKDTPAISPKEQKRFLLAEIDKALELAPIGGMDTDSRKVHSNMAEEEKVDIKEWYAKNQGKSSQETHVTIEVPGDGQFKLVNTIENLWKLKKAVKARFPEGKMPSTVVHVPRASKDVKDSADDAISLYGEAGKAADAIEKGAKQEHVTDDERKRYLEVAKELRDRAKVTSNPAQQRGVAFVIARTEAERKANEELDKTFKAHREKRIALAIAAIKAHPAYAELKAALSKKHGLKPEALPEDLLNMSPLSGSGSPAIRALQDKIANDIGLRLVKDETKAHFGYQGSKVAKHYDLSLYYKDFAEEHTPETEGVDDEAQSARAEAPGGESTAKGTEKKQDAPAEKAEEKPAPSAHPPAKLEDFGEKTKETAKGVAMFRRSEDEVDAATGHGYTGGVNGDTDGTVTAAHDAEYLKAVESGDMEKAQSMVDARLAEIGSYWHGTPSGDLRGGVSGLHIGTKQAAMEALEARIGIPADGKGWDGTREYGKTLLAGKNRIRTGQFGKYKETGYNAGDKGKPLPDEDFYPADYAIPTLSNGTKVDLSWKPWVRPVLIVGPMAVRKKTDSAANSSMRRLLRQGRAVEGFYYKNEGEDYGSTSAVLPNGEYVRVKLADPVTRDDQGNVIPLSQRFNEATPDIRFRRSDAEVDAMMAEIEREDVAENFRALPSTDPKARDMQADVQVSYAYNLAPKTVQQMQDEARGVYEKDKKQAQLDLLAGRTDSGNVNTDARRMATDKIAVDDLTVSAVADPDDESKTATAMLAIWRWYERGTDVARALRLRFDPVDTPEGRRAWIMRTLLAPTRAEAEIIRRAGNTADAISALKVKAKFARAVLKKLRAKGTDISALTADQLMDDVYVAGLMRDISSARSGWGDVVHEWWRNAILSAPTTPLVNTIGNAGNAALEAFVQRPVEALINTVARNDRAATFRSIGAMYRAIVPSMSAANKNFLKAWATEKPVTGDSAKVEESDAAIPGWFGKNVVRVPQRVMLATDEWFKTVFMAMLTADYATREFDRLVNSGKQKEDNREAYVLAQADKDSSAYAKAWEETLRWSFQQKPGHMAGAIMNWRNDPQFGFLLKFIFPFVRTPANIISAGLRKTPLNAVPYIYKAATGKYSKEDAFRLGAEQAVGMVFMLALYEMMKGDDDDPLNRPRITGSRKASSLSPKGMNEAEMRDYPPMSVRVGDKWVSYKRLEPFATMTSTMVDALTAWDQAKAGHAADIPATLFASVRGNLADKTFLLGVGNLVSIMEGDELAMSRALTQTLAGFNPNIIRATVRAFDPYIRETRTQERGEVKKFAGKLAYQSYPSASNAPEPKIGKDGKPVEREGGGLYNALVPFAVQSADKTTKVDAMVKRYNERVPKEQRWWPSSPEPSDVTFGREKIRMTDEENAEYKRVAGQIAERRLSSIGFNYADPGERDIDRLKKVYEKSREAARDRMRPAVIRRWKAGRSGGEAEA